MLFGPRDKQPEVSVDPPRSWRKRDDDPEEEDDDWPWGHDNDWDDEDDY